MTFVNIICVSRNITLKTNLDIRESSILPRLRKLRADGDTGVAKEIEDALETFKLGSFLNGPVQMQYRSQTGETLLPW